MSYYNYPPQAPQQFPPDGQQALHESHLYRSLKRGSSTYPIYPPQQQYPYQREQVQGPPQSQHQFPSGVPAPAMPSTMPIYSMQNNAFPGANYPSGGGGNRPIGNTGYLEQLLENRLEYYGGGKWVVPPQQKRQPYGTNNGPLNSNFGNDYFASVGNGPRPPVQQNQSATPRMFGFAPPTGGPSQMAPPNNDDSDPYYFNDEEKWKSYKRFNKNNDRMNQILDGTVVEHDPYAVKMERVHSLRNIVALLVEETKVQRTGMKEVDSIWQKRKREFQESTETFHEEYSKLCQPALSPSQYEQMVDKYYLEMKAKHEVEQATVQMQMRSSYTVEFKQEVVSPPPQHASRERYCTMTDVSPGECRDVVGEQYQMQYHHRGESAGGVRRQEYFGEFGDRRVGQMMEEHRPPPPLQRYPQFHQDMAHEQGAGGYMGMMQRDVERPPPPPYSQHGYPQQQQQQGYFEQNFQPSSHPRFGGVDEFGRQVFPSNGNVPSHQRHHPQMQMYGGGLGPRGKPYDRPYMERPLINQFEQQRMMMMQQQQQQEQQQQEDPAVVEQRIQRKIAMKNHLLRLLQQKFPHKQYEAQLRASSRRKPEMPRLAAPRMESSMRFPGPSISTGFELPENFPSHVTHQGVQRRLLSGGGMVEVVQSPPPGSQGNDLGLTTASCGGGGDNNGGSGDAVEEVVDSSKLLGDVWMPPMPPLPEEQGFEEENIEEETGSEGASGASAAPTLARILEAPALNDNSTDGDRTLDALNRVWYSDLHDETGSKPEMESDADFILKNFGEEENSSDGETTN